MDIIIFTIYSDEFNGDENSLFSETTCKQIEINEDWNLYNHFGAEKIIENNKYIWKLKSSENIYAYPCLSKEDLGLKEGFLTSLTKDIVKLDFDNTFTKEHNIFYVLHDKDIDIPKDDHLLSKEEQEKKFFGLNKGLKDILQNTEFKTCVFQHEAGVLYDLISDFDWDKYGKNPKQYILDQINSLTKSVLDEQDDTVQYTCILNNTKNDFNESCNKNCSFKNCNVVISSLKKIKRPLTVAFTTTKYLQKDIPDNIFAQLRNHFKTNSHTPVITISHEDIFEISEPESEKHEYFHTLKIDRRFRFLDSSIWNYYLPLNDKFQDNLTAILSKIVKNYESELYASSFAKEFIELHYRVAKNSYLKDIEAHASHVAPFVFHSEEKMKRLAKKKLEDLNNRVKEYKGEDKITWNILFIDDYSNENLRGTTGDNKTKTDIVKNILENDGFILGNEKHKDSAFKINFETTPKKDVLNIVKEKIVTGQTQEEKKVYDILFLDYLLGTKQNASQREYGYEFFAKEYKNEIVKYKRPLGRFWIFPVTVFTSAMFERLREQGVSRLDDNWFIANGADPVNTPQLFKYNLYNLLEQQLSEAIFTKEDIISFLLDNSQIDDKTETKDEEVRLWAKQVFGSFMYKFGKREILETDAIKGSEFAKSVLHFLHETQKGDYRFYDHIRQLLYLLAYGTGFHATQMWELVNFVDYEIFKKSNINDPNLKETFRDLIPKYVTNLSSFNS